MPLIRKPKSKRVKIKDRENLKKKIKDGRKKNKKLAKKNPQWKSRVKKDPGVPNSFPFKDMIIAEAEQARETEDAERKRKRGLQQPLRTADIEALSGFSIIQQKRVAPPPPVVMEVDEDSDDEAPILVDPDLLDLDAVLDKADVVIHVLDARDPASHRIPSFEKTVAKRGKHLVLLLNKIDLVPRESVAAWLKTLRSEFPTFCFKSGSACLPAEPVASGTKGKQKETTLDDALGVDALKEHLNTLKKAKGSDALVVSVVGLPNVGKSSIINTLIQEMVQPIYKTHRPDEPGARTTTLYPRAIPDKFNISGNPVRLIDTAGFSLTPPENISEDDEAKLMATQILLRRRGRIDKMKSPFQPASEIILRANKEDLMILYNLPAFVSVDVNSTLTTLARVTNRFGTRDRPDLTSAASMVLRDWRTGKFAAYTFPAAPPSSGSVLSASDEAVLSKIPSKKEMLDRDFVRLRVGEGWPGDVDLKAKFVPLAGSDDEEEDEGDDGEGMDVDEDEDEDDGSEEEEFGGLQDLSDSDSDSESSSPSPPSSKRKHPVPEKQKKSVSFSSIPNTKRGGKPSKTALKAEAKAAALARSSQKAPTTTTTTTKVKPALKVAQSIMKPTPKSKSKPNGATLPDQPYDFAAHF